MARRASSVSSPNLHQSLEQYLQHLEHFRQVSPHTLIAYRGDVNCFVRWLDASPLTPTVADLDQAPLLGYLADLPALSPNTIRRRIHALSGWFRFLMRQGLLTSNPAEGLQLPRREQHAPRYPDVEQLRDLIEAAKSSLEQVIVHLLAGTGLRRAELVGLDLADLSADADELRVPGKGRRERFVPVPLPVQAVVRDYVAIRGSHSGPLLLNRAGNRLGLTSLRRLFTRLLRRAGLTESGFTLHTMRHAYATMLVKAGVDLATIRDLLGHADVSVTSIYLHTDLRSKRVAVEALPLWNAGGETDE